MSSDEMAHDCMRWDMPDIGKISAGTHAASNANYLLAQRSSAAYKEAYALGLKEAQEQAKKDLQVQGKQLDQLMSALAQPLEDLDRQVEQNLVALSVAIASQLVKREVETDPEIIISVIREVVEAMPDVTTPLSLQVHPEDAKIVRSLEMPESQQRTWNLLEDPLIARGGCVVSTDVSRVDASLPARIAALVEKFMDEPVVSDKS